MKDGLLLFVVGLILIGGVLLWRSHVDPFHPLRVENVSFRPEPSEPAPAAKRPVVKTLPTRPPAPPPPETPAVSEPAPPRPAPPTRASVVVRELPPFPAADQITVGSPPEAVTKKFGTPAISALTSTGGHMVETFVYARDRGRSATVIRLEDGRVSSAYTKSTPLPAVGLSIPRHSQSE